jgi:ribonuclease G
VRKQIVVNCSKIETRVALMEDNALAELHLESGGEGSIAGHVFKGRVLRVLPGMQAAFVDIGLEKAAFMHVSDFWNAPSEDDASDGAEDHDVEEPDSFDEDSELAASLAPGAEERENEEDDPETGPASPPDTGGKPAIQDVLKAGQEILAQISKEPMGSKGARITSHISLPGRFVVYTPTSDHIGVSRRIENEKERKRLREIVEGGRGEAEGGYIVRTACEGVSKREILADMAFLTRLWKSILDKNSGCSAPSLLHEDLDLVLRSIRDLFTSDVQRVVVDDPLHHDRIVDFIDQVLQPKLKSRVELHEGPEPVFDRWGLETQVRRALERRVWLKSGGYLVIDQTEALTTIDVNTGRFVGKRNHEETVLKTNLEAARVSIDQLRLRNIGGIIVIDFIDMEEADNRKKVSEELAEAVKRDKARTNILKFSELGLVQMTRKRTRDNLRQLITDACPICSGEGRLRSTESLAAQVLRDIQRQVATAGEVSRLQVKLPTELAEAMRRRFSGAVAEARKKLGVAIELRSERNRARNDWEIEIETVSEPAEKKPKRRSRRRKRTPRGKSPSSTGESTSESAS